MSALVEAMTECESDFPGCRWSLGRPADWADGIPIKVRRKKPYEAWVTHGDIGRKGFICTVGDGETPAAALNLALTRARETRAALRQSVAEAENLLNSRASAAQAEKGRET